LAETPSEQPPSTDLVPVQAVRPVEGEESGELQRREEVSLLPAVAAATSGFLLGVATFVLVKVLRRPKSNRLVRRARRRRGRDKLEIAASRSFLVDVHLLDRR
jgi:hypothetical protein